MNILNSLMNWFSSSSWTELMAAASVWVLAFRALANLTPTNSDNAIVEWLYKIFAVLGIQVPDLVYNNKGNIVSK